MLFRWRRRSLGLVVAATACAGATPTAVTDAPSAAGPAASAATASAPAGSERSGAAPDDAPVALCGGACAAAPGSAPAPSAAAVPPSSGAASAAAAPPAVAPEPPLLAEVWHPCCPHDPCCGHVSPTPLRSRRLQVADGARQGALLGALSRQGPQLGQCFRALHGLDAGWPRQAVTLHLEVASSGVVRLGLVVAGVRPEGFETCLREAVAAVRLAPARHATSARWELTFGE